MAGRTLNKLAKRQPPVPPLSVAGSSGDTPDLWRNADPSPGTFALSEVLDVARMALARAGPQAAPRRHGQPQLVASSGSHEWQLTRIVELEIIPRLMLMHSPQPLLQRSGSTPAFALSHDHVQTLGRLAAEGDAESASRYVSALLDAGATAEQVFLDLLAPCARWLGECWSDDVYDFSQVTIGLWRLQRVLYEHGHRLQQEPASPGGAHRALMAAVPGAQHTFGVVMVAEFFSRAGWEVDCSLQASWHELQDKLAGQRFDMLGLSVATVESIPGVASAILAMRKASANPAIFVMVGGPVAAQLPDLARLCGADAMACEACSAVDLANQGVRRSVKVA